MTDQSYAALRKRITTANAGLKNAQPDTLKGFNLMHAQAMQGDSWSFTRRSRATAPPWRGALPTRPRSRAPVRRQAMRP